MLIKNYYYLLFLVNLVIIAKSCYINNIIAS